MRLAHGLRAAGVERGDDGDHACWTTILMPSQRGSQPMPIGGIHVPVNTAYKGEFLRHQIADAGAPLVIAESDYAQARIGRR